MEEIIAAIEEALEKKGISAAAASKQAAGNFALIKNLKNRKTDRERRHLLENLMDLADVLDLEFYFGPPREPVVATLIDPSDRPDYALVPAYPVEASAGDGATAVDVAPDGALAFRKDWMSKHGISLDNATLLRARGDSMEPIIWDGDLLLIDRSRTTINASTKKTRQKAVYVVELEGQLLVKTLRRPAEDRILVISENVADYDAFELRGRELNALRIVGKVVWWGHTAS